MVTYALGEFYQNRGGKYNKDGHPEYKMDYATAIDWYRKTSQAAPKSVEDHNAQCAIRDISKRSIVFKMVSTMPVQQPNLISFSYKNSQEINFRIVPMTKAEFNQIPYNEQYARFIAKKPVYETSIAVPDEGDYRSKDGHFLLPPLKQGTYLLIATNGKFDLKNKKEYTYKLIRISNLAANYRQNGNLYEIFVFDRVSGAPVEGATIWMKVYGDNQHKKLIAQHKIHSDKDGKCRVTLPLKESGRLCIEIAHKGENFTLTDNDRMPYYWNSDTQETNTSLSTYIFTDRNLYRPGQTVYYKGIVVERTDRKNPLSTIAQRMAANINEIITLHDANGQEVTKVNHTTNEFGSFYGSFVLPTSGLTGEFRLQCTHGSTGISVEEYKRPTFDIEMDSPKEQFKLEQEVRVTGRVKAYAGYALDGAEVRYSVVREASFPWWRCWWWRPKRPSQQIASGTVTSDADGKFTIAFVTTRSTRTL